MKSEATARGQETYDLVEKHVAQVGIHSAKVLGRWLSFRQISRWLVRLFLDNAVAVTAPATGVCVDDLRPWPSLTVEIPMDDQMALSLEDVLAAERLWLQEHEDVWSSYGNAVVRVLSRGPGGWEHLSSRALEQVISATTMALVRRNRAPRSIFDPLCGSGTLLMAAASDLADSAVQICGQDISEEALATTERVLAIGGRASSLRADDLIVTDSFPNDTFDLVVTDPPLGLKADPALWNGSTTGSIPSRLPPGTPEVRDLEWLFLAMALQKVTPREKGGGTLVTFVSRGALHRRLFGNSAFREWLHDQGLLRAIVALPRGVHPSTGVGIYGLVLSTSLQGGSEAKVQVIDLRGSFDTTRNSQFGRTIAVSGEVELLNALAADKPSGHVRTIMQRDFVIERYEYVAPTVSTLIDGHSTSEARFTRNLPRDSTGWEWPLNEERDQSFIEVKRPPNQLVDWSIDRFMNGRLRQLESVTWRLAPLLTLVKHVEIELPASARDPSSESRWFDVSQVLALPLDGNSSVFFGELSESETKIRAIVMELVDGVDGTFLASWLSSKAGIHSRSIANELVVNRESIGKAVTGNTAVSLLAHILVPVPESVGQGKVLEVHEAIEAERRALDGLSDELWTNPQGAEEIMSRLRLFQYEEDLSDWSESLPYPIASALRTAQSLEHDPASQAKQLIHFWEASAQFFATYLLSALRGSEELWQREIPVIRGTLSRQGNSFDLVSFGTWKVTIERLSRLFRSLLAADDADEQQRAMDLLGHPPSGVRDSMLSGELTKWISNITTVRNTFHGHAATMSHAQMAENVREFDQFTQELRSILRHTWREFPLVRPHVKETGFRAGKFSVTVDTLVGPTSPFLPKELELNEALEDRELYLIGYGGSVKLLPFVKIGRAPQDPGDTALFYNRRTPDGVRMVAYMFAAESDITATDPDLQSLLDDIKNTKSTDVVGLQELDQ